MREKTSAELRDILEGHLTHMTRHQNTLIEFTNIMKEEFTEQIMTKAWEVHMLKCWRRLLMLFEPMMESHQDAVEDWRKVMKLLLKELDEEE